MANRMDEFRALFEADAKTVAFQAEGLRLDWTNAVCGRMVDLGWSQEDYRELAEATGITPERLREYMEGHPDPGFDDLVRMFRAVGLDPVLSAAERPPE